MVRHWNLALLLVLSVLLGVSRAISTCQEDGTYKCVAQKYCKPTQYMYRSEKRRCPHNQVCCANDDIRFDNPCQQGYKCVATNLCQEDVGLRSAAQCPNREICCKIETPNDLSIKNDKL